MSEVWSRHGIFFLLFLFPFFPSFLHLLNFSQQEVERLGEQKRGTNKRAVRQATIRLNPAQAQTHTARNITRIKKAPYNDNHAKWEMMPLAFWND
jgi:hypothetical protein